MATFDIEQLRGLTDGAENYTDIELQSIISAKGSIEAAARYIWQMKAASVWDMVDRSESGSSLQQSQLHKQALTMADAFKTTEEAIVDAAPVKRVRRAVRR